MDQDEVDFHQWAIDVTKRQVARLKEAGRVPDGDPRIPALVDVVRNCGSDTVDVLVQLLNGSNNTQQERDPDVMHALLQGRGVGGPC